jgi:2-amino-4-hydroxy-6-hydroxymethyldihydropteridine diphosphokinase
MVEAYLSLGSNMGDKRAMLEAAAAGLDAVDGVRVAALSRFYRTPPWGDTDQDWFLNAAARLETTLSPHDLLAACLAVERSLGRVRERKWGPRTIDIDVLAMGDMRVADETLVLPHPYVLERAFVLVPLAEIAPDLAIGGVRIADALARLDRTGIGPDDTPPLSQGERGRG